MDQDVTTNFQRVIEFHVIFDALRASSPTANFDPDVIGLRLGLIKEELQELEDAIKDKDLVEVADALTDILYVVYGFGVTLGINLDETFKEVHASNLTKLGPNGEVLRREDGKIIKGPNFRRPDLKTVLETQLSLF